MRPRHRRDNNHNEIVQALRQAHVFVLDVHGYDNCLDIIACRAGIVTFLEVKDGSKPASARKLTPAEVETIAQLLAAGVRVKVVKDVTEALRAVGAIL